MEIEKRFTKTDKSADLKTYAMQKKGDGLPAPRMVYNNTLGQGMMQRRAAFGGGDVTQQPTFWYSPEMTPDSWLLPKSRVETLRFCQIYYNLNPYIHSILNMHAQYAFSKFFLQYKDPDITELFNKLLYHNQDFDWYQFTLDVALSYYKYGEACVWGSWDTARKTWDRFTLLNPSIVDYKEDMMTGHATVELIPTPEMKQIVKDALLQGRRDIDPLLLDAVENNKKLPLDTEGIPENVFTGQDYVPPKVFMFQRRTDPSSERGTSMIQCARGTTKVKLLDGTTPTMRELYESGKQNFWVYSVDNNNDIVFKKADKVIYKGKALTYDITLDNGAVLGFTAEHPFMLRDGSWKCVKDLVPGDSLMPLYTKRCKIQGEKAKTKTRYEKVYNPKDGKYVLTHVKVALQEHRDGLRNIKGARVIHHKDFNSLNNTPENLRIMTRADHAALHLAHINPSKEWFKDFIKKGLEAQDRVKHAETMREYWKDPEYREYMRRKQKEAHARHTDEERIATNKKIGEVNAKKYDATRLCIADKIQKAVDALSNEVEYRPSFSEIANKVGDVNVATVYNYVNKYKLVELPNRKQKPTCSVDLQKVNLVQAAIDANPTASQKTISRITGIPQSTISFYKTNGHISVYKNHKVVSVKPATVEDVYDIACVDETHNFMVVTDDNSGVCVHNCLFKDLYYQDMLRMSQIAVAQKTQLPIELWTVGHIGNDPDSSMLPGPELLEEVRQMITAATQQPPFSIVYGPYLKYEALGVTGKLLDIYNDLGYVENQILVGLGVNKAVVLGEGPSVQGKTIALNRLIREYAVVRDLFSNWFKRYILLPIAKANHLVDDKGQYIVPDLIWELSLQPEQDKETFDMFYKMWKDGLISTMTLFEKCPKKIDYALEMSRLSDEVGSVFDKGNSRLGKVKKDKGESGASGGAESPTGEAEAGGVEAGKGNPELRDFALGGGAGEEAATMDTELPTGAGDEGGDVENL